MLQLLEAVLATKMKIDKVLFACSEGAEYSPFWNVQAEIYRKHLGIEPICLLYGKKANTNMSEEHGTIIEMETDPAFPWSVQLTWSKFDYPTREPDTTWLIGDIDLVPLQRAHFIDKLVNIPDTAYVHLNPSGISQARLGCFDGFLTHGPERRAKDQGISGGADLPGHYHVAKGKAFEIFTQGRTFMDQVKHIVTSDRFGMGVMSNQPKSQIKDNPYWYYWCAEECYTSEILWTALKTGMINFVPIYYNNGNGTDRINRDAFTTDYQYDPQKVAGKGFVDIHCARPYEKQREALARILKLAWGM